MTQITIAGHAFTVPEGVLAKYAVGTTHTLDEGTASTLQQVTCENLRNNFTSKVKKEANGGELTEEARKSLQAAFDSYAASYSFGVRTRGERTVVDPVEKEARKLAKAELSVAYKARHNEKLDAERLSAGVDKIMAAKGDEYMKRARAILRERNKVAENVLDEVPGL